MVVPAWIGHLNPMTSLGRALAARGHDVAVLSFPEAGERVLRKGLEFIPIGEAIFPYGEWERRTRELSVLQGLTASRYTIDWIGSIAGVMLNDLGGVLSAGRFDGVVMDQVCCGAECTADRLKMPLAVASNALPVSFQRDIPVHTMTWQPGDGLWSRFRNQLVQRLMLRLASPFLNRIRAVRQPRDPKWDAWSYFNEIPPSLAHVVQLPACLDFPRRYAPDHFHHTGPWHETSSPNAASFEWSWLDGRPFVYASLGTLQNGLEHLYQLILDAVAELPMQLVLALGREGAQMPASIPPNAKVLGYAPQTALLARASLVITHAGMNTTLEALAQGLPLVALPIANEQPGIAARIRYAGVGEWAAIRGLTPAKLHHLVEYVHRTESYRNRAQECARELARVDGRSKAAAIIETAVTKRRRVTRETWQPPATRTHQSALTPQNAI